MAPSRLADRIVFGLFLALVVTVSLPLASNRPWSAALLGSAICLLCAFAMGSRVARGQRLLPTSAAALPAVLLAVFALWVAMQLAPWGHSEEPFRTRQYLVRCLAYGAGLWLVLMLCTSERRRLALLAAVVAGGVVQALLAIVLFSSRAQYEFLGHSFFQGARANGTFANPDHLAQYMALTLSAGIGLMLAQLGGRSVRVQGWRGALLAGLNFMMSRKMLLRLLLVILVITLVLTRSRMGNAAFFIGLLVLAGAVAWRSAHLRKPALLLVASLLVVDIIVVGQWVGLDKVVQRLKATDIRVEEPATLGISALPQPGQPRREETLEERLRAAEDTMKAVAQRPVAGWGGGSFYVVFPSFKGPDLVWRYDHTHMDYIEIATDTGLVGLALLGAAFAATAVRVMRLLNDRQSTHTRGVAAGVGMALLCAFIHAWVDFNLQITANALTLTLLLALPWTLPVRSTDATKTREADTGTHGAKRAAPQHQGNPT